MIQRNVFSIDVEDWFHILDTDKSPSYNEWEGQTSIIDKNFHELLDLLDEAGIKATCFFLGWVARKYPHLVKEAKNRGHEIASHGFRHELIFKQTPDEFKKDITDAKKLLEDMSGGRVLGYRAPEFSIKNDMDWALDAIRESGYGYDTSLFPAKRGHGGYQTTAVGPRIIETKFGSLMEFPITVASTAGRNICYFGGGYLRLFPYWIIRKMAEKVIGEGRPIIFYIHPRDISLEQPRFDLGVYRNFKSYVNIATAKQKIQRILRDFKFTTFSNLISTRGQHV